MRYFLHIGYHGRAYGGWQKHPGVLNVQGILEQAISKILKTPVAIVGCGRTDAQVHAAQFFFHMDVDKPWSFDLLFRLNKVLPDDIAVFDIIAMEGLPHARFDAISRTYDYFIHTRKDPFLNNFSSYYPVKDLNFDHIKAAIALLTQYTDYKAFCKSPDRNEHTICNIYSATLFTDDLSGKIRFNVSANRFLGKMVRTIVGRLLKIGIGNLSVDEFHEYLIHPDKPQSIVPAYPQGLYLTKVIYPYLDILPGTTFAAMLQNNLDTEWLAV
ncbi:tRNA pseudouridine synthase A [Mucilaginibacter sp. AW1-3]